MTVKDVSAHGFVKTPGLFLAVSFSTSDGADLSKINENARRNNKVKPKEYDDGPSM